MSVATPAPQPGTTPRLATRPGGRLPWVVAGSLVLVQAAVAAINLTPLIDSYTVRTLFDVNGEANLVAWLSSAVLLAIGAGAGLAAAADRAAAAPRRRWLGWALIGIFFAVLSADEAAGLHELIGEKAHRVLDISALPSLYTWVLVVGPIGLVAAVLLVHWFVTTIGFRSITGRLGLVAIALWLGVPALEALDPSLGGPVALSVIEESLEAVGEALFLAGVLCYLACPGRFTALASRLASPPEASL